MEPERIRMNEEFYYFDYKRMRVPTVLQYFPERNVSRLWYTTNYSGLIFLIMKLWSEYSIGYLTSAWLIFCAIARNERS